MKFVPTIALLAFLFLSPDAVSAAGLVPCSGAECNSCHVVQLANGILKWLIGVLFVIFAIMIAAGGFEMVVSGGNESARESAKNKISNAIIGIVIVLAGWLLVDTVMRGLLAGGEGKINGNFWYTIQCDAQTETEDVPSVPVAMPTDQTTGAEVASCDDVNSLITKFHGSPQGLVDPALNTMISCYKSDSAIAALLDTSQIFTVDKSHPICAATNGNPVCGSCSHSVNSCHYGRGSGKGAQGVDFNAKGGAENQLYDLIKKRQPACGGKLNFEGNHTHVSLSTCGT